MSDLIVNPGRDTRFRTTCGDWEKKPDEYPLFLNLAG